MKQVKLLLFFLSICIYSKGKQIPVDPYSGTPHISIPFWVVKDHDLSATIGLSYHAQGIKLEEIKGQAGVGWNLVGGGGISREVRGLPDDYEGTGSDTRVGWLYNSVASDIELFSDTADETDATCSDETSANSSLQAYNYKVDTEPDIFHFQAGDISGSFVFGSDSKINLIPYQDISIEYTTLSESDKTITSFTITTNTGVVYTFDQPLTLQLETRKCDNVEEVEFLRRDFTYYDYTIKYAPVEFTSQWLLSETSSPSGALLSYEYNKVINLDYEDTIKLKVPANTSSGFYDKNLYRRIYTGNGARITHITSQTGESVNIHYINDLVNSILIDDSRRAISIVKRFNLNYEQIGDLTESTPRTFLTSIEERASCVGKPSYQFTYVNIDLENKTSDLPRVTSLSKDYWGYYNGKTNNSIYPKLYIYPSEPISQRFRLHPNPNHTGDEIILPGADRNPEPNNAKIGSLETIKYPSGGSITLTYESNEYYDPVSDEDYYGPGLRIGSVTSYDGMDPSKNLTRTYTYTDETGHSSGRMIDMPAFYIPSFEYRNPFSSNIESYQTLSGDPQNLWSHLVVRSNINLNSSILGYASRIGYSKVIESTPGIGTREFEFELPAIYGESSVGEWSAISNRVVRPSSCESMGILQQGGPWTFPFTFNPNFDQERGFLLKETEKNVNGVKVSEKQYSSQYIYENSSGPIKVYGLTYDHYPNSTNVFITGKYYLLTGSRKVIHSITNSTFDLTSNEEAVSGSTEYLYESSNHHLLTKVITSLPDGSIITKRIKYPKDFGDIPTNSNSYLQAIKDLQSRNGIEIEHITSIQRPNDVEKVVGADLKLFADFGSADKVLTERIFSLETANGLTDFVDSHPEDNGSMSELIWDPRYTAVKEFLSYDNFDAPISTINQSRIVSTTSWGHEKTLPVVEAFNVDNSEFAFSNFETDEPGQSTVTDFTLSDKIYGMGRTGQNALYPSVELTKTVSKADVDFYMLSLWAKKNNNPIDFTITLKDETGANTLYTEDFEVSPESNGFEYFEKKIPVANLPSSFKVELKGIGFNWTSSDPGLLPLIDDVSFYPQNSELNTYTYLIPFGTTSVTSSRHKTTYTDYDSFGRPIHQFDQDHNIISKSSYHYANETLLSLTASVNIDGRSTSSSIELNDLTTYTFSANQDLCIQGVTYEWDFGSGFQNLGQNTTHSFSTLGSHQIVLKKSHPAYDPVYLTITINVLPKDLTAIACAKGAEYVECNTVTSAFSCNDISENPTGIETYYKVTGIDFSENIVSYSWQRRFVGFNEGWSEVGTGQVSPPILPSSGVTYEIRCFVTTVTGRSGYSNIFSVTRELCGNHPY